ncbi:MAG: V-type ATP synthase subunit E [Candidatus Micrarchaeota archaeon]|nr:V-type ATP synthase subunit E [Candidatus Micrarchaeota archaeon]
MTRSARRNSPTRSACPRQSRDELSVAFFTQDEEIEKRIKERIKELKMETEKEIEEANKKLKEGAIDEAEMDRRIQKANEDERMQIPKIKQEARQEAKREVKSNLKELEKAYRDYDKGMKDEDPVKYREMAEVAKAVDTWFDWGPVPVRGLRQVSSSIAGQDVHFSAYYAQSDTAPMFMPKFGDWRFLEYEFHGGFRYAFPGPFGALIGGIADLAQPFAVSIAVSTKRAAQKAAASPNPFEPMRHTAKGRASGAFEALGSVLPAIASYPFPIFFPALFPGTYGFSDPSRVGPMADSWLGRKTGLYRASKTMRNLGYKFTQSVLPKKLQLPNYGIDGSQTDSTLTRGMYPYNRQMYVEVFNENLGRPPLPGQYYTDPYGTMHLYPSAAQGLRRIRPDLLTEDDRQASLYTNVYTRDRTPEEMYALRKQEEEEFYDASDLSSRFWSETSQSLISLFSPTAWVAHKLLADKFKHRKDE